MQKLNRKGFTLIELLSIIIILGLVSGITITIVLTTMANAKEKSKKLTRDNIAGQAEEYIYEGFSDSNWISEDGEEYKCITVQDLIDAGYFKQDIIDNNEDINANTMIRITRNSLSKVITSKTISNAITTKCIAADGTTPVITCNYSSGYGLVKRVTLNFKNSDDYEKRLYLGSISDYELVTGFNNKPLNGYYNINESEAVIDIKEEGLIIASVTSEGNQQTSTYCNVTGIDKTKPTVTLTLEEQDGSNILKCQMKDMESGLQSYKICKVGDTSCQYENLIFNGNGKENANSLITRTKSNLDIGKWQCFAKDKVGNEGNSGTVNITPEVSVTINFKAEELNSSGGVSATHTGENWTNKNVRLTGTIDTNTETWYILSDSVIATPSNATGWTKCNSNNCTVTEILNEENVVINKTYYLYVKYNEDGVIKYEEETQNVKIDKKSPIVNLIVENTNNLKCTITDEGSGVNSYRICETSETNCSYQNFQSNPVTLNDVSDGTYYCYGKDKVGNVTKSSSINVINTPVASVSINFKAEELNSSGGVSGTHTGSNWTNKSVKLTGTINTNVDTWYKISASKIDNPSGATGWTKCNSNNCEAIENLTQSDVIINKTYYLYIKYNGSNGMEYEELTQKVKIDKKLPICDSQITTNNSSNGISATIACKDQTDGSGCQTSSSPYTNQTTSITKIIKDNASNSRTCKINISLSAKKKYCQEDHYNERCMTYDNYNDSGNLVTWYTSPTNSQLESRVTCASGYSTKNGAKYQFRYYIRQERNNWKTSSQEGSKYNLKKSEIKLCYSTKKATWEKIEHTQGSDNGKYFWYAKNIGSGSGDSPLQRAIKGLVVCGDRPSSSSYPNLASFGFTTRYSSVSTSNFPSSTDRIKHKGYSCQYESSASNEACPSGVTELNKLVIPLTGGGYYVEEDNADPDSGPNNWNGEEWFTCTGKYVGTIE